MATEPLPQVVAVPCPKCGEEAIVQMILKYDGSGGGVRLEAKVSRQCGCEAAR
jgi:hypothetical protein